MATDQLPTNGKALPEVPHESPFQEYLTILLRGKWVILLTVALVIGATAFYTFRTRPVYESTAMVLIDLKDKAGKVSFLDLTGTTATNKITNELETLKSRSMAEAVAKDLLEKNRLKVVDAFSHGWLWLRCVEWMTIGAACLCAGIFQARCLQICYPDFFDPYATEGSPSRGGSNGLVIAGMPVDQFQSRARIHDLLAIVICQRAQGETLTHL